MKYRALTILLLANAVLFGTRLLRDAPPARAQQADGDVVLVESGDINGDGEINITDAVRLLGFLFQGAPPPEPVACPSTSTVSLPATGQSTCYDSSGSEVPCSNGAPVGQDGLYQAGCDGPAGGRFEDNGDGTVTDHCTGLMWMRGTFETTVSWSDAVLVGREIILTNDGTWVLTANDTEAHGGTKLDDWRLPNARELGSIVDFGRLGPAASPLLEALPAGYWTSSTFIGTPDSGWCINLHDGMLEPIPKVAKLRVVVVRDAD